MMSIWYDFAIRFLHEAAQLDNFRNSHKHSTNTNICIICTLALFKQGHIALRKQVRMNETCINQVRTETTRIFHTNSVAVIWANCAVFMVIAKMGKPLFEHFVKNARDKCRERWTMRRYVHIDMDAWYNRAHVFWMKIDDDGILLWFFPCLAFIYVYYAKYDDDWCVQRLPRRSVLHFVVASRRIVRPNEWGPRAAWLATLSLRRVLHLRRLSACNVQFVHRSNRKKKTTENITNNTWWLADWLYDLHRMPASVASLW